MADRPLDDHLLDRLGRLGVALGTAGLPPPAGRSDAALPGPSDAADPGRSDPAGSDGSTDWDDAVDGTVAGERATGRSPAVMPIEEAVPGLDIATAHGACYASTVRRAVAEVHGGEPVGAALAACTESLAALARRPDLAELDLARTAFVDTETTGLMGGTGTYAFLIGVGRFVGETFQVRQLFMRHPGEERAQLAALAEAVDGCTGLVTFNGRTFDLPLLSTRHTLHHAAQPLAVDRHLDLLPLARRIWRRRLSSCALTSLERHVLGFERVDDVPGWLIPYRYLTYQNDGDARPLVGIFQHNALDILSMVSLVSRLARAYREPDAELAHGADWLAVARAYAAAGAFDRARDACEGALARGLAPTEADDALRELADAARRAGDWPRAVAVWESLAADDPPRRLFPFEELAKYWEHRAPEVDLARALGYAERARALVAAGTLRPRRGRRTALAALEHRIARLERRLGRR